MSILTYKGYNPSDRDPRHFETPKQSLANKLFLSAGIISYEVAPSILIVDLSHWNGNIVWKALRESNVVAVILKCSEAAQGTYYEYKDTKFETNWRGALDEGFPVMLYHFFRGEKGSAEKAWFMKCADAFLNDPRINGNTAVWLDCEWKASGQSRAAYTRRAFGFTSLIRGEGMRNGIYSSPGLVPTLFDPAETKWDTVNQWNAHWTSATQDTLPAGWSEDNRVLWQFGIYPTHSWTPTVNGAGTVDVNHGYWANEQELRNWLGQSVSSPSPSPSPSHAPDCCEEHELRIATLEAGQQVITDVQMSHDHRIAHNTSRIGALEDTVQRLNIQIAENKHLINQMRSDLDKLLLTEQKVKDAYCDE